MRGITLRNMTKRFGRVTAVDRLSLDIQSGSFLTLLGPSGCGKTTTLRCLAGLEEPEEGEIYIDGRCVFSSRRGIHVPPGQRGVGLVFQNYALWPHMTVFQNVAFGLKKARLPKREIHRKVHEILKLLGLAELQGRYPHELSGGQQQRVALARMVVTEPRILLFDEPLSNLDAKLRMTLRSELKRLHMMLTATTVYVTHDQIEAMTLSTRIVVLDQGVVQQIGSPAEVYHHPANLFVAEFMGNPSTNLLGARVAEGGPPPRIVLEAYPDQSVTIASYHALSPGMDVIVNVRPEDVEIHTSPVEGGLPASLYTSLPTGSECVTYLKVEGGALEIVSKGPEETHLCLEPNQRVWLSFKRGNVFDKEVRTRLISFGFEEDGGEG